MPTATFITIPHFTGQGIEAVRDTCDRAAAFRATAAKLGVRVTGTYWTPGPFGGVIVCEAPDEATATAVLPHPGSLAGGCRPARRRGQPARVKAHAAAGGRGSKADPADARAVAAFARGGCPPAWQPPAPEVRELQGLVRRVEDLVERAARAKGRLACPALAEPARRSVGRTIRLPGKGADKVKAEAEGLAP